eukprot:COSAG01_NODE_6883_length_3452_cov_6.226663_3_plen_84_part_00
MGFIFGGDPQPAGHRLAGWRAGCWLIFGKIRPQEKSASAVIFRSPELRSDAPVLQSQEKAKKLMACDGDGSALDAGCWMSYAS